MKNILFVKILILCVSLTVFSSCKKDENLTDEERIYKVNKEVKKIVDEWYLWYDEVEDIDPKKYLSPDDYIRALRVFPPDRWSSVQEEVSYDAFYKEGEYIGLGLSLIQTSQKEVYIRFVYKDSPADKAGLKRSDKILEINGQNYETIANINQVLGNNEIGISTTFKYLDLTTNETKTVTVTKELVKINTVLATKVLQTSTNKKVGYIAFQTFIEPSEAQLDAAFDQLKTAGVQEFILDMRYNGGGRLSVANYLASKIVPSSANDKVFVTIAHNDKKEDENEDYKFEIPTNNLNLSRVFVIASNSTASASESVINGLKPYMPVIQFGGDSYGKPVGSYGFRYEGYVISPISIRVINANGTGDYYDGIPTDYSIDDDLRSDFGTREENTVGAIMDFIENGSLGGGRYRPYSKPTIIYDYSTIQAEIGAF